MTTRAHPVVAITVGRYVYEVGLRYIYATVEQTDRQSIQPKPMDKLHDESLFVLNSFFNDEKEFWIRRYFK